MADDQRRRDLEETDAYDVRMFPAPRPMPPPPVMPVMPPAAAPPPAAGAPAHSVPPTSPAIARRPAPPPAWPAGWRPPYDTSALAVLSATTLLIFGIVGAVVLGFLLAIWDAVARLSLGTLVQVQTVESTRIVLLTLLLVAIAQVVAAIGVFAHRGWARLLGIAISVPGTIVGTLLLIAATSRELLIETWLGGLLLGGYGFSFFGLIAGNSHFRRLTRRY